MTTIDSLHDFVRRGIAAQDAADRAAGRPTAAELDNENTIVVLRARLHDELATAITATQQAARTLAELTSAAVCDVEYAESQMGQDVAHFVDNARRSLTAAHAHASMIAR
ncbi:MAG: methyltransferase type 11 [Mycolicibacterium sp.]|uniref:methyltransferase type 11 n=1 Tax=Mycolicibacterium sp. TaxID=2320850 RepID=UPI003D132B77